jgi:hypothetical protein
LPLITGNCSDHHKRFFFDNFDGLCKRFTFTGCGGNSNNFETFDECELACGDSVHICELLPVAGRCYETTTRWFFDLTSNGCRKFIFTGCDGNGNNFEDKESCTSACDHKIAEETTTEGQELCHQARETGPCEDFVINFYYDENGKVCWPFYYGGCEGNENRFETREECETRCW